MKKIKSLLLVLLILIVGVLGGCTKNKENTVVSQNTTYPLKVSDYYKREITIDKEPNRIVSVAPNLTEIVFALGKGDKLVGRTDYCDYPAEASKVESVGQIVEPNIEKIVDLKPDVVLVSNLTKKETVDKLSTLGIKVVVITGKESFDGIYDVINQTAAILNSKKNSDKLVSDMKNQVKEVTDKVKNASKPKVYYVVGYGKTGDFTSGKNTFIGNMIELAGGVNAANDVDGWQYSIEKLVEKNPDIMICSKFYDTKKGIEATEGYKDLTAVKSGKLLEIDDNLLNKQGPRVGEGLLQLAKLIHPELFK